MIKNNIFFYILLSFVVLCIGLFTTFFQFFSSGFDLLIGDAGDARFITFILENSFLWLTQSANQYSFSDLNFFYPALNTLFYSDTLIGIFPFYWVIRFIGFDPFYSLQILTILFFIINFYSFYFLSLKLNIENKIAIWGAFIFAFALPRQTQLFHLQLLPQFFSLYSLYFFYKFCTLSKNKYLFYSLLFLTWQFYTSWYLAWFLAFLYLLFLILYAVKRKTYFAHFELFNHLKQYKVSYFILSLIIILLISPLAINYLMVFKEMGGRTYSEIKSLSPSLSSWFSISPLHWEAQIPVYSHFLNFFGRNFEKEISTGLITSFLFLIALYNVFKNSDRLKLKLNVKLVGILVVLLFVLSNRFGDIHFWSVVFYSLPSAKSIRALARIILIILPLIIYVSMLVYHNKKHIIWPKFLNRLNKNSIQIINILLIISLAEQLYNAEHLWSRKKTIEQHTELQNMVEASNKVHDCKIIYFATTGENNPTILNLDAMWVSLNKNIKTINGYSGLLPNKYNEDLYKGILGKNSENKDKLIGQITVWFEQNNLILKNSKLCIFNLTDKTLIY